jgi:hypothetical protein
MGVEVATSIKEMKVAIYTLELGLVDKFVEVAPAAVPGHQKIPIRGTIIIFGLITIHSNS